MITFPGNHNKLPADFDAWRLIQDPRIELIKIVLKKGEKIAPHINQLPVIFYCINGSCSLLIEDANLGFKTGMSVYVEAGNERGLENNHSDSTEILVIKLMK